MLAVAMVAVLLVGVGVFFLVQRPRAPVRDRGEGVSAASLEVDCASMRLGIRRLRAVRQESFTGWGYYLICAEPAGCYGSVRLTFHFVASGKKGEVSTTRFLRLARGQALHDGFIQRPAVAVERITRVEGEALAPDGSEGVPTPLPW